MGLPNLKQGSALSSWLTYCFNESDDVVELTSVELSVPLPDIYRRVQFQKDANRDG